MVKKGLNKGIKVVKMKVYQPPIFFLKITVKDQ